MDTWLWIAIVAVAAVAVIAIAAYAWSKSRARRYRSAYGSEYEHLVGETGSERAARQEIERREKRVKTFDIRPLDPGDANRFTHEWTVTQTKFVDEPVDSVVRADGRHHRPAVERPRVAERPRPVRSAVARHGRQHSRPDRHGRQQRRLVLHRRLRPDRRHPFEPVPVLAFCESN